MPDTEWSAPESAVYAEAGARLDAGDAAVLATVVGVDGSAYRRPGAKMLVAPDGEVVGHVTSGCLESEIASLARGVLEAGRPRVETYDLMEDDEDVWGLGVGCNGVVDVLLEPLDESLRPAVEAAAGGPDVAVCTVLEGDDLALGDRFHLGADGDVTAADVPGWLRGAVADPARALLDRGGSDTVTVETAAGEATVFVDAVTAPPELVVVGSGHDVEPVVDLARRNDFRVTVVGFRGATDLDGRFPRADRTLTTSPADLDSAVDVDEDTYAVVMTHNFVDDRIALETLLDTPTEYVGLMGPHERFEELVADIEEGGRSLSSAELDVVYTPVGLDVGADFPYQIATSIVAEVLAVHADREPGHLRASEGAIHERVEVETAEPQD